MRAKDTARGKDWNYGGEKWKLSRSKIELFMQCKKCFYLDNKLGVSRPRGPSFTLNIAVDALLKKEFDAHRAAGSAHPLMKKYGVDAVPFKHEKMDVWRENFQGIQYKDKKTGLVISGAVDDIWLDKKGKLIIVDYKATSKEGKIESLSDSGWDAQYKRQMEIYQWLFRHAGFDVSDTGYFVYVNGRKDEKAFDGKLEFDVTLIAHKGDDSWVEGVIAKAKECLESDELPESAEDCEFCAYRKMVMDVIESVVVPLMPSEEAARTTKPKRVSSKSSKLAKINKPKKSNEDKPSNETLF